jgi:DNA-binding transcriptional ArsR family regulator
MGKLGDTKKDILGLLETKNSTLTDIVNKLDLAPSTVSQHLKELTESGQIRLVQDKPRKWKYYEINRGPVTSPYERGYVMQRIVIPIAGIILVAILAIGLYHFGTGGVAAAPQVYIAPGSTVPSGSTVFSVSDSPQSYNISALFITVTNVSVQTSSGKWMSIPLQEHTFNLVGLRNISEILSGVNLSVGSYRAIALSASNVTAIVNGTSENVFLPNGRLLVVGGFNISSNSTNWVNIDFNLQKSLHITANGTLIMLPVLVISRQTGGNIQLNSSSIIIARGSPERHEGFECGMEANGSMKGNFSFAQNGTVGIFGRRIEAGEGSPQFLIRTHRGFIIGPNAVWLLNGNLSNSVAGRIGEAAPMIRANASSNWTGNGSVVCPMMFNGGCHGPIGLPPRIVANGTAGYNSSSGWHNTSFNGSGRWQMMVPPPLMGSNASGYVDCDISNGGVSCTENDSANITVPMGRLGIGRGR